MILLLNSAVMPNEGVYTLKQIPADTFKNILEDAAKTNNFRSYIGYTETAGLIEQITGVPVDVSREQATLTPGDTMLIVKLRKRIANPADKDTGQLSIDDIEFYKCDWQPLDEGDSI